VDTPLVALIAQTHLKDFQGTAPDRRKVIPLKQRWPGMHETSPFDPVSSDGLQKEDALSMNFTVIWMHIQEIPFLRLIFLT